MSPSNAQRLVAALEELRKMYPDWRFGQLVANVAYWAKGPTNEAVWDVEDEEFIKAAEDHIQSKAVRAS